MSSENPAGYEAFVFKKGEKVKFGYGQTAAEHYGVVVDARRKEAEYLIQGIDESENRRVWEEWITESKVYRCVTPEEESNVECREDDIAKTLAEMSVVSIQRCDTPASLIRDATAALQTKSAVLIYKHIFGIEQDCADLKRLVTLFLEGEERKKCLVLYPTKDDIEFFTLFLSHDCASHCDAGNLKIFTNCRPPEAGEDYGGQRVKLDLVISAYDKISEFIDTTQVAFEYDFCILMGYGNYHLDDRWLDIASLSCRRFIVFATTKDSRI